MMYLLLYCCGFTLCTYCLLYRKLRCGNTNCTAKDLYLCTYCLLDRNICGPNTNCTAGNIFYVNIVYCTGTFVVLILIVLQGIYSMYILFIVPEHLWS